MGHDIGCDLDLDRVRREENDAFGSAVAISNDGTTVLVSAPGRNSDSGATSVFHASSEASWPATVTPEATLTGATRHSGDYFGWSVALSSDGATVLIGAYGVNSPNGAAYIYQDTGGAAWTSAAIPTATLTGATGGDFGNAVALAAGSNDATTALIGADHTNGGAGAAYVFSR